jgi:hypothetical protein
VLPRSLGQALFSDYTASVRATLHRFLLMLLILALPLQGWASASMMTCLPGGAPVDAAAAVPATMACHEQTPEDAPLPAQHDCQHCAACVLASAPPIPLTVTPAIAPVSVRFIPHPAAAFSGFIPDGPERPPRLSPV